ncbi:MAG: GNAT family N-acetyltransferase [Rubrobacteraceae bacterium]
MVRVHTVSGDDLGEPLRLLENSLRDGEPASDKFVIELRSAVEAGDLEVLTARLNDEVVGVLVLARRLSISVGGQYVSIEELYVLPKARGQGMGRALLGAVEDRCGALGTSYVEVQAVEDAAEAFYRALGFEIEADVKVMSRSYPMQG